ncbi:MAG: MmcQ/YjbR family DNA-binding protein [Bacteroidales bacterium]
MDVLGFRDYCLSLPLTEESTPFDEYTLVYKIGGKMYAYANILGFSRIALKCDPEEAVLLREKYIEITPAWHSNKRHWIDVSTIGMLSDSFIKEQIRKSYSLVIQKNVSPKALCREILDVIKKEGLPQ